MNFKHVHCREFEGKKKKITYNLAQPRNIATNILISTLLVFFLSVYITEKCTYLFTKCSHVVHAVFN